MQVFTCAFALATAVDVDVAAADVAALPLPFVVVLLLQAVAAVSEMTVKAIVTTEVATCLPDMTIPPE
jgi:hypothetical protein